MRRLASVALVSGFAISALIPLTLITGAAGAVAASGPASGAAPQAGPAAAAAIAAATPTPTAAGSQSPSPKPSRPHETPAGQSSPAPRKPPGPPAPAPGMPQPSANCLTQRGRAHLTGEPWAQRALGFSSVWDLTRGQHITVAVVDSGIDDTPQLAGRVSRADLTGGDGEDCIPHGTIVASIIAARDARAAGIPFYGVAPAAHILSIRVQQQEGTGGQSNAVRRKALLNIARGIRYAVAQHAKVINVSIQVSASYPALRSAVDFALHHNVVVVAAAGNDTPGAGQGPFYPAGYPGVLSVNAVDSSGQLGNFDVRRTPVSVTAPGVDVASDYPGGFKPENNGTSFAAAFVSGEAALVRAAYPRLSAAQVVHRIIATADGRTGARTGAGMINPVQAVTAVLPQQPAVSAPPYRIPIPRTQAVNPFTHRVALAVTGGALAATALVAIAAIIIPRGNRRHWRPGRLPPPPIAPTPPHSPALASTHVGESATTLRHPTAPHPPPAPTPAARHPTTPHPPPASIHPPLATPPPIAPPQPPASASPPGARHRRYR